MENQAQERASEERLLLYIDILNFVNLIAQSGKVEELYEIINKLHVDRHDVFTTIISSDTILVYNKSHARGLEDVRYLGMHLYELAQHLFYQLIARDIHFPRLH